ncbi:MAG: EAL domain-containing protein [Mariprofundales bacterium]|nr:EAL domain-containing protein [Mariprofundales bacterium]
MPNQVRLLIVDDEERNRELLCDLLDAPDYLHLCAESGERALEILAEEPDVAVVLLDINLMGIDGLETLRELRKLPNCNDIPVLLFTGAGLTSSLVAEGLHAGAVDFFGKPFNPELVEAKVHSFVHLYRSRQELGQELKLAATVFDASREALLITDADQKILTVNDRFVATMGFARAEVVGKTPALWRSRVHEDAFFQEMWAALQRDGIWQGEINNRLKNGKVMPQWLMIRVIRNTRGEVQNYLGAISAVGAHVSDRQQLYFLAHYDQLTKLPNRKLFMDILKQRLEHVSRRQDDQRLAVLFLDLDHFKNVNDTLGHDVGDILLKEVAQRLKGCVRGTDIVARIGGDEFVAMLTNIDHVEDVMVIASKMQKVLEEPVIHEQHEIRISVSIGISMFPDDGSKKDELMRKADVAMYQVKESGRNGHQFYTESMQAKALRHLQLEKGLRKALENNEFTVYYQPFMDASLAKPIGMEALLRWDNEEFGRVSPAEFIPVAENCGLITEIGAWVLRQACFENKRLQEAGFPPLTVAVNLSSRQFHDTALLDLIDDILASSGLSSNYLELELTEGVIMQENDVTATILMGIYQRGIQLSVDDFGTGYSSMSYLRRFKVDKLKVDQSFVQDMVTDSEAGLIVQAMINLGHSLSLKVIAEGVEEKEQADWLAEHGCDEIQGYYYGRPMPIAAFTDFVRGHFPDV